MAVRSLPPNVSMSAARRAASSVAGAAAAMPASSISGAYWRPIKPVKSAACPPCEWPQTANRLPLPAPGIVRATRTEFEDRPRFADAHQIGMGPGRPEPGIVGRGHDIAPLEERLEALDMGEMLQRERGCAGRSDTGGRMRPGDDRPAAGRRRTARDDDQTRDRDGLVAAGRRIDKARDRLTRRRARKWIGSCRISVPGGPANSLSAAR